MVHATIGRRLGPEAAEGFASFLTRHGFDSTAWRDRLTEPGLFQSGAVGSPESRQRHALAVGKKWIADKTGIWI